MLNTRPCHYAALLFSLILPTMTTQGQESKVDFATQVKPLLSDRCFLCHGPDAETREADLRLDSEAGILGPLASDEKLHAVVPGQPAASELVARILSTDPDLQMPPPDSGLKLTSQEQGLLKRWVAEGAEWKGHWAFEPITAPVVPDVRNGNWCQNEIDHFVVAAQEKAGYQQNPRASKERLIRRATFDLTGLPPSLQDLDRFLQDNSDVAFEKLIDRLLASEEFGERMAANWLDVARYSDTYGYQVDRDRYVWPWRDWVIQAFNDNMPHDRFVVEQLAGDLLPNPTRQQRLATTFNRLHPQKVEGGSVPEEFRVEYVADRTQTVATAFMGLTFECCRCHDHKYDPFTQRDYYQLFSFFNTIDEAGLYSYFTSSVPTPTLRLPTDAQEASLKDAQARVDQAEAGLRDRWTYLRSDAGRAELVQSLQSVLADRTSDAAKLIPGQVAHLDFESGSFGANRIVESPLGKAIQLTGDHGIDTKAGNFPRWQPFSVATWIQVPRKYDRSVVFHRSRAWTDAGSRGYELLIEDGVLSAALIHFWPGNAIRIRTQSEVPLNEWLHVALTYDGSSSAQGLKLWLNGALAETSVVQDKLYKNVTGGGGDNITIGERFRDKGFAAGKVDDFRIFDRHLTAPEIGQLAGKQNLVDLLTQFGTDASVSPESTFKYVAVTTDESLRARLAELKTARESLCRIQDSLQEIMVMEEGAIPRQGYILERGAYDAHGEEVPSEVPAALPARTDKMPANRLGLARWLTSAEHPLTARVSVNRFWQLLFGEGLVRTPEDFGSQGAAPTHAELLDWLATDFRNSGWDVKRLLKKMMMSATYQQSSTATDRMLKEDPENLLLTRAFVHRLTAEMLRDNALAVSGLLQRKIGGAPVRPYELAASFKPSKPDTGAGLYRRSLYTYWKRTAPAPVMMTLDASKRDVCRVKRERTASPLQALVVMNGPQFVEASRMLADRLIEEHGPDDNAVLTDMFRLLTSQHPTETDRQVLLTLLNGQSRAFADDLDAVDAYLAVGEAAAAADDRVRLAAWTSVANTLLAFDECMMRR